MYEPYETDAPEEPDGPPEPHESYEPCEFDEPHEPCKPYEALSFTGLIAQMSLMPHSQPEGALSARGGEV